MKKSTKGASKGRIAPVACVKLKKKPRGKSFEPGNGFGSQYRFKPGQSGNPSGRSTEEQKAAAEISKALAARLVQVGSKRLLKTRGRTFTEKLADEWIRQGLHGNWQSIAALADRLEGKPAVTVNGGGTDNLQLLIMEMRNTSKRIGPPEGAVHVLPSGEEEEA